MTATTDLDSRYGRGRDAGRRNRLIGVFAGLVGFVVVVAWLVWGGLLGGNATIEARDLGYEIVDDSAVRISIEVTADAGSEVGCAVQALNQSFTVVGWKIIELPVTDQRTRQFTEEVRTTELAVTGLIYRCWLL